MTTTSRAVRFQPRQQLLNLRGRLRSRLRSRRSSFLLVAVAIFFVVSSRIPSTAGFTTTATEAATTTTATATTTTAKKPIRAIRTAATATADDEPEESAYPPLGYVLKERNPYDVHVYYATSDERRSAMELRSKLEAEFGDWMRFYPPKDRPIGPHPVPMWEADFGGYRHRHNFRIVRDFLVEENAGRLSILIHPHSVDTDYADHTEHAFWDGPVLPLRIGGWRRR